MAELLDDALAVGAMGLSTNRLDHDGRDGEVSSLVADDEVVIADTQKGSRCCGIPLLGRDARAGRLSPDISWPDLMAPYFAIGIDNA